MNIILVYNADSGILNGVKDMVHRELSPNTYECNLCTLTYGYIGPVKEWQKFTQSIKGDMKFLHRDEFRQKFPSEAHRALPAIFFQEGSTISQVVDKATINSFKDVQQLISHLTSIINHYE